LESIKTAPATNISAPPSNRHERLFGYALTP